VSFGIQNKLLKQEKYNHRVERKYVKFRWKNASGDSFSLFLKSYYSSVPNLCFRKAFYFCTNSLSRGKCSSAFKRKIINQWYIKEFTKYSESNIHVRWLKEVILQLPKN
jgi:hypothetical protein